MDTPRDVASIAYVSHAFPLLTETFVYREVAALQRRGFRVETFAIWKPDRDTLPLEARHLVDASHYVFPISWSRFLRAHLGLLYNRPREYLQTLVLVLTRRGESLKNRRRTFLHFCEAVYLAPEMKRLNIRHIHAQFAINAATIALVCSRLLGITFSFTAHNSFFRDRVILREKAREARFMVAISQFTRESLLRLVGTHDTEGKIHVVHCGLSPDDFAPPDPKPANEVPVLLFVGQLTERKGAPVLVEACRILSERGASFRCAIVGDGPQRTLLEQLIEKYALRERVELAGVVFQEHLKAYLQRADLFVLPCVKASNGDMDGIPVSLMEAMAMEIATVSTHVSGIPELIEDGVSGLLAPEGDAMALADTIQRLLEDGELRLRLGEGGRQKVLAEFDIDNSATQLQFLFAHYLPEDEWPFYH